MPNLKCKRRRAGILALTLLCLLALAAGCARSRLDSSRWARETSWDRSGRNDDFIVLAPGESRVLADLEGPGEIAHLWFTIGEFKKPAHRQVVLRITWDDATGPSVLAPIGDYFGVGRGMVRPYENDFISVAETDSLNAFFPMPFRRRAHIEVVNQSDETIKRLYYYITWKRKPAARDAMYFHAAYRQEKPAEQGRPYEVLSAAGRGTFLGLNLGVVLNTGSWWGEGDDIVTVDGKRFNGTGTEDYFGGAWSWSGKLSIGRRFGVTEVQTGMERGGLWNLYRFHSEAPIPFRDSFKLELEHGLEGYDERPVMANNYTSVAFYYLDRPQAQPPLPSLASRLQGKFDIGLREGDWIEAEASLADGLLFDVKGIATSIQSRPREREWSGAAEAALVGHETGSRFVWVVDLPTTGTLTPSLAITRQPSGFDFDLYMNGNLLAKGIGGYNPTAERKVIDLRSIHTTTTRNYLEVVATGADPRAIPPAIFAGLDSIKFVPGDEGGALNVSPLLAGETARGTLNHLVVARDETGKVSLSDDAENASLPVFEGDGPLHTLTVPGSELEAIRFAGGTDRVTLDTPGYTDFGDKLEISFLVHPDEDSDKMRVIFSKNQAMACWLTGGKLTFWVRDIDWRFLALDTRDGMVPAKEWTHARLTLEGRVARIFLNGALCAELEMQYFRDLNKYPGRLIVGGSENQLAPFVGAIADFRVRSGRPAPAAGEELPDP